jgi:HTH-type transcriptional regulator, cell division transcriptional repressor
MRSKGNIEQRFSNALQQSLIKRYGKLPTASFVAKEFDLQCEEPESVTQETVRRWIRGLSIPSDQRLRILVKWLKIDFNTILLGTSDHPKNADHEWPDILVAPEKIRGLHATLHSLTDPEKLVALRMIAALQQDLTELSLLIRNSDDQQSKRHN